MHVDTSSKISIIILQNENQQPHIPKQILNIYDGIYLFLIKLILQELL
jgi:hypothetical protein